jgi:hypothetical protein
MEGMELTAEQRYYGHFPLLKVLANNLPTTSHPSR